MNRRWMELIMGCVLLICFYYLSGKAADIVRGSEKEKVIVVDAGHGGTDPGMIGVDGLEEKKINLEIAKKLKDSLEKAGYRVVLTREKDEGLYDEMAENKKRQDLDRRITLMEKEQPFLTLSIHQNSYSDPEVYGPQVFYYETSGESQRLAHEVQKRLNEELAIDHPRTEKGNKHYYLLKKSRGICVIIECGFLTNRKEAQRLQSEKYQKQIARMITNGVNAYVKQSR